MRLPPLETDRLRIRPFTPDDFAAFDRVNRGAWEEPARREYVEWAARNAEELALLYQPPYGDRAVCLRATGELIGVVGFVPALGPFGLLPGFDAAPDSPAARRNVPEVGLYWAVHPDHRNRGYATEAARALIEFAFTTMNLRRIIATTEYENHASQAVMRRLGMRIERNPHSEPPWFQIVGILENTGGEKAEGEEDGARGA
jgi:RimJ/RimL family protein N-acetyltransferase